MRRPLRSAIVLGVSCLVPVLALRAQQPAAPSQSGQPAAAAKAETSKTATDPIDRIKEEGLKRSQVMMTLSYLTDVIGPRLTGSPNMKRANEWTRDRLAAWGVANAHLEPWGPFGRGWSLKRFSAQVIEPQCIPVIAYPKAWSPGTEGSVVAPVVYFDAKSEADFARFKGKIKGAVVLTTAPREVRAHFEPLGTRKTDSELLALADAPEPEARGFGRGGRQGQGQPGQPGARQGRGPAQAAAGPEAAANAAPRGRFQMTPERRAEMELAAKKLKYLADEGAAMLVDPSGRGDGGTLFVQSATIPGVMPNFGGGGQGPGQAPTRRVYDKDAPKIPPQIVMASEHYNRLVRMIEQGERPKMVVDLSVQFHDEDLMAYNTVAEISGTDPKLKDEVVMLGGHMDSWHSGTGATDNGAGVSVAMEAMRILQALDLKPRRTIRIALWSGEEEGLLGSRAFVTQHFGISPAGMFGGGGPGGPAARDGQPAPAGSNGSASSTDAAPKPEYAKFQAYFNLDNGTGKVRGVYLQGNEAVRPIFRKWLVPFREMGANTLSLSNTGGTDHLSFDGIGLPGFQFIQDEIEYDTRTHHSNQDVYDRIQAEDMKQAAVIMASFVYNAATMDEKLPRKPAPAAGAGRRSLAGN
jgi:carboxypeptidase Q